MLRLPFPLLVLLLASPAILSPAAAAKTRNVVIVTLDGLRWQEVFRGADDDYIDEKHGGIPPMDEQLVRDTLLAPTPQERRERLMPFLWTEIAKRGQIFGNRDRNSLMQVSNAASVSYPGYNEMLCGFPDDADIVNNARVPNPNVTVLEWLNHQPGFEDRVVPLAAWNVFASILNVERSKLPLWLTNQTSDPAKASPRLLEIEQWMRDIPTKTRDEHYDAFVFHAAVELLETKHPRVLFVGFGETDSYGHRRAYGSYLESANRLDRFIRGLWTTLQSMPQYRASTTLIVTTDHGRGAAPETWPVHNSKTPGSEQTWLAIMGPDTPPLGERTDSTPLTNAQIAATIAKLLGEDFNAASPKSAQPIADVFVTPGSPPAVSPTQIP